jgi:hypothetical protein
MKPVVDTLKGCLKYTYYRCIYKSIKMQDERERSLLDEESSGENPDENAVSYIHA